MPTTKGLFKNSGPRIDNPKHPRMDCCGSTHHSIHLSECETRTQKPKIDPVKAKILKFKEEGLTSDQVSLKLKMELREVNKLWV